LFLRTIFSENRYPLFGIMREEGEWMRIPIVAAFRAAFAGGIVLLLALSALAQTIPPTSAETAKGKALVDLNGMTLYVFDRDGNGKSNCNGQCAVSWLPLIADTDAQASESFSFISRDDGRKQWAYKGKPLYTWAKDKKPGDATGDGFNNAWHVASP
jgi:predicted lipoprotein with Yx(FWY)xxD motif